MSSKLATVETQPKSVAVSQTQGIQPLNRNQLTAIKETICHFDRLLQLEKEQRLKFILVSS